MEERIIAHWEHDGAAEPHVGNEHTWWACLGYTMSGVERLDQCMIFRGRSNSLKQGRRAQPHMLLHFKQGRAGPSMLISGFWGNKLWLGS